MPDTQLLCTFTTIDDVNETLKKIIATYYIAFDTIYILQNNDVQSALCCTYNINLDIPVNTVIPEGTISLHRKKVTNTLYTINALNLLVEQLNEGRRDKKFQIPWNEYRNTILVTAYNNLKVINTKLDKIVKVSDIL